LRPSCLYDGEGFARQKLKKFLTTGNESTVWLAIGFDRAKDMRLAKHSQGRRNTKKCGTLIDFHLSNRFIPLDQCEA